MYLPTRLAPWSCRLFAILLLLNVPRWATAQVPSSALEGLWHVQQVRVGADTMTPVARWLRLEANGKQQSGNGGLQHSYGTWAFAVDAQTLRIHADNGLADTYPPFEVSLWGEQMTWQREEEGARVIIVWTRAARTPLSYRDSVLGYWAAERPVSAWAEAVGGKVAGLFLRWDGRFRLLVEQDPTKALTGVYHVHGHRPQLTLIPDDHQLPRSRWRIRLTENTLRLTRQDSVVGAHAVDFQRSDRLPE